MSASGDAVERMVGYKKDLFVDPYVQHLLGIEISNVDEAKNDSDFVKLIRERIIDKSMPDDETKLEEFMKEMITTELRKILIVSHSIIDLLFFFSDYFPEDVDAKQEHKNRVKKYENLLRLIKKINIVYIEKIKRFVDICKGKKVIIIVPLFPNIAIQSFFIMPELQWLRELIIDEETKSLRENIEIHLLFLNEPFLGTINDISEKKQRYFRGDRTKEKTMINSLLKLNKLRLESFVKRYLTEYILKELDKKVEDRKITSKESKKIAERIAYWLTNHLKAIDENVDSDENIVTWSEESLGITGIKCGNETETMKKINGALDEAIRAGNAEECYDFSSLGAPELLGFRLEKNERRNEAAYKDILYYLEKEIPENALMIYVQQLRSVILFDFYIDKINEKGKIFFSWDSYIPLTEPPVIPIFQYFSTLSKSYNYSRGRMYEEIVYNCNREKGQYMKCYLAHYLEYLFKDVLETFDILIKGPRCECGSATMIIKEDCDKLKGGNKCGTKHWIFECSSHWEKHVPCGSLTDYLWLPMEIYYTLEKIFLDIPYTFMLTKREYVQRENAEPNQNRDNERDIVEEFENTFERSIKEAFKKGLKERFKTQWNYIGEFLGNSSN